ncbi:HlyD family type I secretion periplasmic adaptor subunit [Sinorhizobium terangae]|uniref:Membrane fusion protein (MFP) family protein n=1 Tax=Sinorhizobium terangae TaxID=110322 RepID=A0A6N7LI63_SINTE|nr:HlyD family type I secretion periplasmic adaptor subunit [Sinorhizobium terangae]MBB4187176.1 HlyD family secretion protein [Sinorhizobium terangae]MQX16575.1 HlyD family type I secretion periplasmic adaptor subunit [Sinorhizobium terangae]WFU50084.1 HlyD family type I secretion periplasmic adaptor subunit [Sinorhizobium terangae]
MTARGRRSTNISDDGLTGRRPLPPVIAEFQSDAVELEERVPPRIARLTLYGIAALIAAAVLWASISSIDEVVVAPGKLVTTRPNIILQPLETSIVRSIDVTTGEVVRAGQALVMLDATFSQSDFDQQRVKLAAFGAQIKRIEAELANADYSVIAGNSSEERLQVQLFGQRRAFYVAQLQNFDQQIAGQLAAIEAGRNQEVILLDRRESLTRIENARETLYKKEKGSLINFLSSRDARLDVDANLSQLRGKSAEAEHALARLRADRQAFIEDFRRTTTEQLVELRGQRDTASTELKKMELRREMVALTAPADAVVLDLAQRSVGSVVREAEPIVTLVPLNVPLEAEVEINARDIGRVTATEEVRIKFDAYPFQKYGTASGSIRTISRDAFTPNQQDASAGRATAPFFKARVSLGDSELRAPPGTVRLLPGMTVSAEIKVGGRTVISYFLYPLLRGLDDAIREP